MKNANPSTAAFGTLQSRQAIAKSHIGTCGAWWGAAIMVWILAGSLTGGQTNAQDTGESANLLTNGSFEQGGKMTEGKTNPEAWEFGPTPTGKSIYVEEEPAKAHSGSNAIGIISEETTGDAYAAWYSDRIEVMPGSVYAVKGWIKTSDCIGRGAWLWIFGSSEKKGEMLPVTVILKPSSFFVDTQDWQEWSAEIQASADTRWLGVACRLDGEGKAWFDDVSVTLVK